MTENLEKIASDYKAMHDTVTRRMVICAGTGCIANGSLKLYDALLKEIEKAGINVAVELKTCPKAVVRGFARWGLCCPLNPTVFCIAALMRQTRPKSSKRH